jgi:hypothetical protein
MFNVSEDLVPEHNHRAPTASTRDDEREEYRLINSSLRDHSDAVATAGAILRSRSPDHVPRGWFQ